MKKLLATLCIAAALVGCQTAPKVSGLPQHALIKKVAQPQNKTIAYFDARWKQVQKPAAGGYYRKLYGKTAQGHYIAQDFYQDTQTKQVDPFEIINEKGLTIGNNSNNTGDVVWYDKLGNVEQKQRFDHGRDTGNTTLYHPNAAVHVRIRPLKHLQLKQPSKYPYFASEVYAPDGTQEAYILWHGNAVAHLELYEAGKKILSVGQADVSTQKNRRDEPFMLWLRKGAGSKANQSRALRWVDKIRWLLPESAH